MVLDTSVAVAAFWPVQGRQAEAETILRRVLAEGATVPALWTYEVGHVLLKAERNRELTADNAEQAMRALLRLPVTVAHRDRQSPTWLRGWHLAWKARISFHDAAFLDLALTLNLPLATFDGGLRQAAVQAGVGLLPQCVGP